jgi:hypothetical protein
MAKAGKAGGQLQSMLCQWFAAKRMQQFVLAAEAARKAGGHEDGVYAAARGVVFHKIPLSYRLMPKMIFLQNSFSYNTNI